MTARIDLTPGELERFALWAERQAAVSAATSIKAQEHYTPALAAQIRREAGACLIVAVILRSYLADIAPSARGD